MISHLTQGDAGPGGSVCRARLGLLSLRDLWQNLPFCHKFSLINLNFVHYLNFH